MQPYWLPYLGYFQLMKEADVFVYYDDVTYIKGGWINRNNMRLNGEDHMFTLELKNASSFKKINEIEVGGNRNRLLKTFLQAYARAPYFKDVEPLLYRIFENPEQSLFWYIAETHQDIFDYLDFKVNASISSWIEKDVELKGQVKVIDICRRFEATRYVNAIGGQKLYSRDDFKEYNIELKFLQSGDIPRRSIIDVLMHNSIEQVNNMLNDYTLV